jgi:hypothetical protein
MTVSVILDRSLFKGQVITTDDVLTDNWKAKIKTFMSSPRDGRQKVLFVEKLSGLQVMLRNDLDVDACKVVLYDTCDTLVLVQGIEIVDAKATPNDTWSIYKMLPERFHAALQNTGLGVPDGILEVDLKRAEDSKIPKVEPEVSREPKGKKKSKKTETTNPYGRADAKSKRQKLESRKLF